MALWHMHSNVLQGFYASEVYVSSEFRHHAIHAAMRAYDRFIAVQRDDYGYDPLVFGLDVDDLEYPAAALAKRAEFVKEVHEKLIPLDHDGLIFRKT